MVRRFPLINAVASPVEYESEPRSMFDAVRAMLKARLDVVAVYHSHPTSPPIPSKKDLAEFYWDGHMSLIISLAGTEPVVRGWWLTNTDYREAEWKQV